MSPPAHDSAIAAAVALSLTWGAIGVAWLLAQAGLHRRLAERFRRDSASADGDGLPDLYERLVSLTDPFSANSDGGEIRATDSSDPLAFPDSASDGSSVVFVHGFRVDETAARAWNAEMFKRLWQSGCNARFHAVDWYGNEGVGNGGLDYHGNVENAFRTAPHLKTFLSGFSADTTVLAHSLGNMVVCSAIQDWNWRPARYFMLNAAVPAEALDPTQWNDSPNLNPMMHEEWAGFPSRTWAARWHELFPENDWRSELTWKNRFADVPARTELHNFYSSGDEVLAIFDMPDPDGSGKITLHPLGAGGAGISSWQKQERFKGRWGSSLVGGFAGTSEMGWGFSSQGYFQDGSPPLYQTVVDPTDPSHAVVVRDATVPFSGNGTARGVALQTSSSTPGHIAKETFDLVWKAVVRDEDGAVVTNAIDATRGHVFYTILDEPKAPWTTAALDNQNPWASALDVVCSNGWAANVSSLSETAGCIASAIFESGSFRYETAYGRTKFLDQDETFMLSLFLDVLKRNRQAVVNCSDCARAVTSLGNLAGCSLWSSVMEDTIDDLGFATRPYCAIGRADWTPPSWGWGFSYHEVAWEGNAGDSDLVFDACLKYNGADNPDSGAWTKMQPIGVVFSDGDAGAPYVYRERLTPPGPSGYSRCLPNPLKKHRFPVK